MWLKSFILPETPCLLTETLESFHSQAFPSIGWIYFLVKSRANPCFLAHRLGKSKEIFALLPTDWAKVKKSSHSYPQVGQTQVKFAYPCPTLGQKTKHPRSLAQPSGKKQSIPRSLAQHQSPKIVLSPCVATDVQKLPLKLLSQCGLNPFPRTSLDSIVTRKASSSTSFTAFCTICICLLLQAHITTCFSSFV